jgi:anti-sigma B factor antagonist
LTAQKALRRRLWRLHTSIAVEQATAVLSVEGRLGHAATAELETAVDQLLATAPTDVIIDLSGVDYLSSAALKVFEALSDRQLQGGGRLTLRAPSVAARLALELSGLLTLVDSTSSEKGGAASEPPQPV